MDICTDLIPNLEFDKSVLTIGSFDGMHSGHMEFIKENYEGFGDHIPDILETIYGSRTSIAEIKKLISDNTSSTASSTVSKKVIKKKVKIVTKGK